MLLSALSRSFCHTSPIARSSMKDTLSESYAHTN